MSLYEHILIARQDVSAAQVEAIADTMAAVVTEAGGEIKKREYWGLRTFTYRIKKNRKGHYLLMDIEAPSAAMQEIERLERLHEDVLRYLTIRLDEFDPEPSPIMRSRAARDDRGGRRDGPPRDRAATPVAKDEAKTEAKTEDKTEAKTEDKAKTEAKTEDKAKDAAKDAAKPAEDEAKAKAKDAAKPAEDEAAEKKAKTPAKAKAPAKDEDKAEDKAEDEDETGAEEKPAKAKTPAKTKSPAEDKAADKGDES